MTRARFDLGRILTTLERHGVDYLMVGEQRSGLEMCLVRHALMSPEPFSETRTGLDHLEFVVAHREDLDDWVARLDQLGIPHSGVKAPSYTSNAMVTFRDPDNIQLEFFWAAPDA